MALDDFISKIEIQRGCKIPIPNSAKSFTPKKNCVYFYRNGNGKYLIEENTCVITFPRFEKHAHITIYGESVFTSVSKK